MYFTKKNILTPNIYFIFTYSLGIKPIHSELKPWKQSIFIFFFQIQLWLKFHLKFSKCSSVDLWDWNDPLVRGERPQFWDLVQEETLSGHLHPTGRDTGRQRGLDQRPGAHTVGTSTEEQRSEHNTTQYRVNEASISKV